jgi:4-amino-4-deoxy-L-arabinose transferase-like glycosyltransferase
MPPVYPFALYLINFISFDKTNFVNLIIFFQVIISTYSVYIFYQINLNLFKKKISIINAFIFSLFPINLFVVGQISSIVLQIFLSLLFLKYLLLLIKKQAKINIIFFSIVSGLLILTRGEFVLIYAIIVMFIMLNKKVNKINILRIILITSVIISPYVIRNYVHFSEIIITKSLGYNLWKGNNEYSTVQGNGDYELNELNELEDRVKSIEKDKYYEITRDNIFLSEAKKNISQDPARYFSLFVKKIFSFYFVDTNSNYPNYYNFFHFIPILLVSILSFPGLYTFYKKKNNLNNYLLLYLILNLIIFSIFFILPRYKLVILPLQIILASHFIKYLINKFKIKVK